MLDGDLLDGAGHDHGGERHDAVRHRDQAIGSRIAERCCDLADCRARSLGVEPQLAAEESRRIETPEYEVRVGDGRLAAAVAVAGRTRCRAGTLRADMEPMLRI